MLQNACKTLGFKKNMVYKMPPWGGKANHIQPLAYTVCQVACSKFNQVVEANPCVEKNFDPNQTLLRQGLSEPELYGDLVYNMKKIVGSNNFQRSLLKYSLIIKRLAMTLMYCNRLHAWWSTQSRLATLHSSLIARKWVGLQTL